MTVVPDDEDLYERGRAIFERLRTTTPVRDAEPEPDAEPSTGGEASDGAPEADGSPERDATPPGADLWADESDDPRSSPVTDDLGWAREPAIAVPAEPAERPDLDLTEATTVDGEGAGEPGPEV